MTSAILFPREVLKFTIQSFIAKRVKSFPIATPRHAKTFVPFCRIIIFPTIAFCPLYNLTPRRFDLESLFPLTDPCAFVCAICCACEKLIYFTLLFHSCQPLKIISPLRQGYGGVDAS